MKAALCTHYGPPEELSVADIPSPKPGKGELVVAVKACGVNFFDALMIQDKYQYRPALPFSPGAEVAGIVKETGPDVADFKPGDRIIASARAGGFAQEMLADAGRCVLMPDGLDFAAAASFTVTYGTTYYALKDRARLSAGERLVVLGAAGGVGISAVELGKAMGAEVIAAASTQEKLDLARRYGADDGFVYPAGPLSREQQKSFSETIKRLTDGRGADVLYDPLGGDYAEPALRAMNWDGRYLVIGFAAGEIPRIPLNLALLKSCDIVGVFWGAWMEREPAAGAANLRKLADWIVEGKLNAHVSARFPLERAGEAIRMLMDRKAQGKVIVVP
jgi:NADPH:quinone reductase